MREWDTIRRMCLWGLTLSVQIGRVHAAAVLRVLPAPSQAFLARFLLRGNRRGARTRRSRWRCGPSSISCCRARTGADRPRVGGAAGASTWSTPASWRSSTYWGHMLGINIETEMRRRSFRPSAEALLPLLRQPEDRSSRGAGDQGSGGDRRGRASRAGRPVHRGDDLPRRLRADVHASTPRWRCITALLVPIDRLALAAATAAG